jgi:hypothetical protein
MGRVMLSSRPGALTLLVVMSTLAGGQGQPVIPSASGLPAFVLEHFGGVSRATLETNALPYKVAATALVMREERATGRRLATVDLPRLYRQFGFLYPARIGNWPSPVPQPVFTRPVGTVGDVLKGPTPIVRIDAVNLGCATCHAGLVYGADGKATDVAWAGLPNSSINLEAYSRAVYEGLKLAIADKPGFRARLRSLFPESSTRERLTIRYFILPKVDKRIHEYMAAGDAPVPYSNGGAGRTNGVATLKFMLGAMDSSAMHGAIGFTSIPDLSSRALRSSLLYDGIYAPSPNSRFEAMDWSRVTPGHVDSLAQIVAFFTVSTMGVKPDAAEQAIPAITPSVDWIATRYQAPAFPASVNLTLARDGEGIFTRRCSSCHGTYDTSSALPRRLETYPNRLVPQDQMGTDPARWAMVDTGLLRRLAGNAYGRHMSSAGTGGYVAPILSGVWATAPYLHNGSVPTLWQLLTPDERPVQFQVGGHALDYSAMGIAGSLDASKVYRYDPAYRPWSTPELYDTRKPGLSNRGHERQVSGLTADQKRALIEYLKTL